MEVRSLFLLTNQISRINPELSGHAPLFKFNISINHENNNEFNILCQGGFHSYGLKGRPLIIIMRPMASLTCCYVILKWSA